MAFASVVFTMNDALVKVLMGQGVPIGLVLALRGVFMVAIFLLLFRAMPGAWRLRQFLDPVVLLRAVSEAALSWVMFAALMLLPIATVTALFFTTPMIATALGALVLGERVRIWRWSAVVLGFLGILVATRPGSTAFEPTLLLPLLAAFIAALRDLLTRRLPHGVSTKLVALSTTVATCLSGFLSIPLLPWPPLELPLTAILAGSALVSAVALFAYIGASRLGEISFLAPIRYLSLPTAGLLGFVVWGDLPDGFALFGAALIVGSGSLIFYREQRLARQA
jgi:drug/metabolite transporter (DMT)-like permease